MTAKTSLKIKATHQFEKDYKLISKQGKSIKKLNDVINLLINNHPLPEKLYDHALNDSRMYKGMRELHIEPDWLLVYKIEKDELILVLSRTGSHSHLFKK